MVLADELRLAGLTILECRNADEAFDLLKAGAHFDLLLTDVHMPGRCNGLDLARAVAAQHPDLPVVVTSGDLVPGGADGFHAFLPKPVPPANIVALVTRLLKRDEDSSDDCSP